MIDELYQHSWVRPILKQLVEKSSIKIIDKNFKTTAGVP